MRNDWLDQIEDARTPNDRMTRIEEWVDQRHGDLGLDCEAPRYEPPWQRIVWGAIIAIVWAAIIAGSSWVSSPAVMCVSVQRCG